MKENQSIKPATTVSAILIGTALMLSGNASAKDQATQAELDAAVVTQATVDSGQNATISAQGASIAVLQAEIANLKALIATKKIGDLYGGGIVFYVDDTGQHGLIASVSDQKSISWSGKTISVTGATGDGLGAGATNTAIIVAALSNEDLPAGFAAQVAADFSVQDDGISPCTGAADEVCYGDWYLPSKYELNLLYLRQYIVGGFEGGYWSSTEDSDFTVWSQGFPTGEQFINKKGSGGGVRAIRAF